MTPATIIREAQADGVMMALAPTGTIKVSGDSAAVNRWLAVIRESKAEIVEALKVGASVATVTVAKPGKAPVNDLPAGENTTSEARREAFEERAAIMEYMGGIDRSEAERLAALQTWPHTRAMNPGEVDTFTARLARFTDKGVSYDEAERLADKLVSRDREGDDRRLCLECIHLQGVGRWRCGNWQAADVARVGLARDLALMLQRCGGFAAR